MFANIGYFHFGNNHKRPIDSLRTALLYEGKEQVRNSLIVLPEGFNIGRYYRESSTETDTSPEILPQLKLLAEEYGNTFIAGLIISSGIGPTPPYSTAYIIDADCCQPLCRKEHDDGSRNYSTCPQEYCDIQNPIDYGDAAVAILICMDADNAHSTERYKKLAHTLNSSGQACKIMCIPACSDERLFGARYEEALRDINVIVANSDKCSGKSFIVKNCVQEQPPYTGPTNKIKLFPPHQLSCILRP